MIQAFSKESLLCPHRYIRINFMKSVRSLLGSKDQIAKTDGNYQNRCQENHFFLFLVMRIFCPFRCWFYPLFICFFYFAGLAECADQLWKQYHRIHKKIDRKAFKNHVMGTKHIQDQHIKRRINQDSIFLILIKQSLSEKPYCSKINCWKNHITFSQTCPVVRTDIAGIILKFFG